MDSSSDPLPSQWDVFVSYASEDRDEFVLELVRSLRVAALRTWFDIVGIREIVPNVLPVDELRSELREFLYKSRFVIPILSEAFLKKSWPRYELDCILAEPLDEQLSSRILPVLHNIDPARAVSLYPGLQRLFDATISRGLPLESGSGPFAVADRISALVIPETTVTTKTFAGVTIIDINPNLGDIWIRHATREAGGRDVSIDVFDFSGNHLSQIDLMKFEEVHMMMESPSITSVSSFEGRYEGPLIYVQINRGLCTSEQVEAGTFCNFSTSNGELAMRVIFATPAFTVGIVTESTTAELCRLIEVHPEAFARRWKLCTVLGSGLAIEEYEWAVTFPNRHVMDKTMS